MQKRQSRRPVKQALLQTSGRLTYGHMSVVTVRTCSVLQIWSKYWAQHRPLWLDPELPDGQHHVLHPDSQHRRPSGLRAQAPSQSHLEFRGPWSDIVSILKDPVWSWYLQAESKLPLRTARPCPLSFLWEFEGLKVFSGWSQSKILRLCNFILLWIACVWLYFIMAGLWNAYHVEAQTTL